MTDTVQELKVVETTAEQWTPTAVDENPGAWVRTSEKNWWYFLEVLPPIYFAGGFACSEAASSDPVTGEPTYLCLVSFQKTGRYYARELTIRQAPIETRRLRDLYRTPPTPTEAT